MTVPGRTYGNYELIAPLGAGGMGEVWRGRHKLLNRQAAIKLIRADTSGRLDRSEGRNLARRFEREARATSLLKSPHTVQVHDFGTVDDGTFYYVMELLEGWSLGELVRNEGPLEPERVVPILQQACESLAEAHDHGLIHRDIKPGNVFLCKLGVRYDHVKVLDFGLVKVVDAQGHDQTQLTADIAPGTPAFMAPEAARGGDQVDARSDIYALGCVAYWLLTGQFVFPADSPLELVMAHLEKQPEPPSRRTELAVPPALDQIVMDCLEKDPAHRPQSAAELAQRLGACPLDRDWTPDRAKKWWELRKSRCATRSSARSSPHGNRPSGRATGSPDASSACRLRPRCAGDDPLSSRSTSSSTPARACCS
jgi:serine/threonine-protein kinase